MKQRHCKKLCLKNNEAIRSRAPQLLLKYFCLAAACWLVFGFCPFLVRLFSIPHESIIAISELSGCGLASICSGIIFSTYLNPYRRHPNRLLVYKTICDLGYSLIALFAFAYLSIIKCNETTITHEAERQQCLARAYVNLCDQTRVLPAFTQLFAWSSEAWFLILLIDLRRSVKNPFYSFDSSKRSYIFTVWLAAIFTAILLAGLDKPKLYGLLYPPEKPNLGIPPGEDSMIENINKRYLFQVEAAPHVLDFASCWIRDHDGWHSFSARRQIPEWAFFFVPLLLVYIFAAHTLYVVRQRLRRGISETFAARVRVAAVSVLTVLIYATYWAIFALLCFFVLLFNHLAHDKKRSNHKRLNSYAIAFDFYAIYCFHKVTKPWWDLLVWLLANDPIPLHQNILILSSKCSGGIKSIKVPNTQKEDTRLRPQANDAMQKELLYYITSGIRQAARASISSKAARRSGFDADRPINLKRRDLGHEIKQLTLSRLVSLFFVDDDLRTLLVPSESDPEDTVSSPVITARKTRRRSMTLESEGRLSHGPLTSIDDDTSFDRERMASWSSSRGPSGEGSLLQSEVPSESSPKRSSILASLRGILFGSLSGPSFHSAPVNSSRLSFLSQQDQSSSSTSIIFVDYKPQTFRKIRENFGVHLEQYVTSFRSTQKERFTEGGSSEAFFFYSGDERYLVKTCTAQEFLSLISIADDYATYMCQQRGKTLIVRLLGAHCLKLYETAFYFLVMENVFCDQAQVGGNTQAIAHFDIKGSWVNRSMAPPRPGERLTCRFCNRKYTFSATANSWLSTRRLSTRRRYEQAPHRTIRRIRTTYTESEDPDIDSEKPSTKNTTPIIQSDNYDETFCPVTVGGEHEANLTLKDNDLNYAHRLRLVSSEASELLKQLRTDARLLASLGIMDYSLLLGVQTVEYPVPGEDTDAIHIDRSSLQSLHSRYTDTSLMQSPSAFSSRANETMLPHSLACRRQSHVVVRHFYYFGIIDILQRWTLKKRLELWWKVHILRYERQGLSCVPPEEYCNRFQAKLAELLLPNHHHQMTD